MSSSKMIYAMTGGMGSGKTTFALGLAKEKGALFLSLDKTIKDFNQPIYSLEDYESYMKQALEDMSVKALRALQNDKTSRNPHRLLPKKACES